MHCRLQMISTRRKTRQVSGECNERGNEPACCGAQADATAFDPQRLFGCANFDRVMISYALSMIPLWREALGHALDVVAPGGSLHVVDFGDCAGLPRPFKAGLRRWLAAFDVTPRDNFCASLTALTAERGMVCEIESRFRGYAILATARR